MDSIKDLIGNLREKKNMTPSLKKSSPVITGHLRNYPPLVIPGKLPNTILREHLIESEIKDIAQLLVKYRKAGLGWDEWKVKHFPEILAQKWKVCLDECSKNGYIGPHVLNDDIRFYQVLGRTKQTTDECTMCQSDFEKGECKHTIIKGDFIPCWFEPAPF